MILQTLPLYEITISLIEQDDNDREVEALTLHLNVGI
jgi:hypothetical protein